MAPGLLFLALLAAAPAGKYPLRFPVIRDVARQAVAERFRAQNQDLRIANLSVDGYGFVELLGVENAEIWERPTPGRAGFGPRETGFWVDLLRKNAAFFGVTPTNDLRPGPAPRQVNFNQMFGESLLATILISKPPNATQPWEVRGHFWTGASQSPTRIDGKAVMARLQGGRVSHVEGGRMYPCDPVFPNQRDQACPPGPPAKTVESVVDERHVSVRLRTVALRPEKQPLEIRTVWHAWVNLNAYSQGHMISGKAKLVVDAVTGEDLTARAANAL